MFTIKHLIPLPNTGTIASAGFEFILYFKKMSTYDDFVHNHPSGDPTPSRADIDMTKTIIDIAQPLGVSVHDHVIVGRDGHASLRGLKLI